MSAIDEFLDMLAHEVTVEPFVSQNQYGEETYGAPVTYKARVMGQVRDVMTAAGVERVSMTKIILAGATHIDTRDRITLPAEFMPRNPEILVAAPVYDESVLSHWVLRT